MPPVHSQRPHGFLPGQAQVQRGMQLQPDTGEPGAAEHQHRHRGGAHDSTGSQPRGGSQHRGVPRMHRRIQESRRPGAGQRGRCHETRGC